MQTKDKPPCRVCGKPHKAKGLCRACYNAQHNADKPPCRVCGKPHKAKGLCWACYNAQRNADKSPCRVCGKTQYAKGLCMSCYRAKLSAAKSPCRVCGKPQRAKGFCMSCYYAQLNADKPPCRVCGKTQYAKGLCRSCYENKRFRTDSQYAIARRLRARLLVTIKNKSASTQELTGCPWEFLVAHIESLFKPEMTWENRSEWHIDHKRPLASFDLTDPEQQKLACHYTNLQPLWAEENLSKGDKYE